MDIKEDGYIFMATTNNYYKDNICIISATTNLETRLCDYNMSTCGDDTVYYMYTIHTKKTKTLLTFITQVISGLRHGSKNLYKTRLDYLKTLIDNICTGFNNDPSLISDTPIPGYVNSIDLLTNLVKRDLDA